MRVLHVKYQVSDHGGVARYIERLAQHAPDSLRFSVERLKGEPHEGSVANQLADMARSFDVVHLHSAIDTGKVAPPIVRTVHWHQAYCPSGTKYWPVPGTPCERGFSLTGCLAARITHRCGSIRPNVILKQYGETLRDRAAFKNHHIIAISSYVARELRASGVNTKCLHTLPHFFPPAYLPTPIATAEPNRIACLARLVPSKGVDTVIRSMKRLPKATLAICGDGHSRSNLEALTRSLSCTDQVEFFGWVDNLGVQDSINQARVVVVPSAWHEPAGLVILEAMALGRPIVATNVGGIPEMIEDGITGRLVPPNDEEAMADALRDILNDDSLASKMAMNARNRAITRFNVDTHMTKLEQIYQLAVNESCGS